MRLSDHYDLPCPEPGDYAALALYMQRLAESVEAKIVAQRAMINDFRFQPVGIWSNSGSLSTGSGGGISSIDIANPVYTNVPGWSTRGINGASVTFPEPGVYHIGWDVFMLEVGALNAGSWRKITFIVRQQTGSGEDIVLQDLTRIVASSSNPAERFGSDGLVVVPHVNRDLVNVRIEFSHNNTSSNVRIAPGDLRGFWRRIGSTEQIEVL